ncbi:MAG: aminopeptidase P family protein [Oscillospiraceae bacterium]|nr:aminopeptidase P family protein [Oscillospiraceae bacterium]
MMINLPYIPQSEFEARVKNVQKAMKEEGFDLLLSYGNEAEPQFVRYFSNYWPSFETAGVLIPAEGEALLLIGPESFTYASDRSVIGEIRLLKAFRESSEPEYPGKKLDTFNSVFCELLGDKPVRRIGVAGLPLMTIGVYEALKEALVPYGNIPIEKADEIVNRMRMRKTSNELACMRAAAEITAKTFDYVLENIRVGMTEQQVAGLALGKMHELGAERESYPVWVLTGEGSNQAISRPRRKCIQKGDMTFIQIGARVDGYASSIGRPVVFGKATEEQRRLIETGYKAQKDIIARLKAGVPAKDIADFHVKNVTEMGYGDWLLYGPCHGNGTMEGEAPWIETNSDYLLEENMTFCVDIFLGSEKTKTGLRMEDVVCVKKDGCEDLTNYRRELFEIECE